MTKPFSEGALCSDADRGENEDDYQGPEDRPKADPDLMARRALSGYLGNMVTVQRVRDSWLMLFRLRQPWHGHWHPDVFRPLCIMHRERNEAFTVPYVQNIVVERTLVRLQFRDEHVVYAPSLPMPVGVTELHIGGCVVRYEGARRLRRGECISAP